MKQARSNPAPASAPTPVPPAPPHRPAPLCAAPRVSGSQGSLTRDGLARALCAGMGLSRLEARALVDVFFAEIGAALEAGESVLWPGIGCFRVRTKPPRTGRNPRTGESHPIGARRVVTFYPSRRLRVPQPAGVPAPGERPRAPAGR